MLLRLIKDYHYDLYQIVLAVGGLMAVLMILGDYAWKPALGYSALTVASFRIGQTICVLVQRGLARRRSRSLD